MELQNHTAFAPLLFANEDAQKRLFDVLIVKASYCFDRDFNLVQAAEQEPLNFTDACFGAVNESSLRYPSDLVPYKPNTDVIVIADAFAPRNEPLAEWTVGIQAGFLENALNVTGPRNWTRSRLGKWSLAAPEKVTRVPLRYELAYGGEAIADDQPALTDERNPLGLGVCTKETLADRDQFPAPQITAPDHPLVADPLADNVPAGFGPVPAAWLPRRLLGGTYDEDWVKNRWPHWAEDYDFAFHNSAASKMKYRGFMTGNEKVTLTNLHPDQARIEFDLPNDQVAARLVKTDGSADIVMLALDTVYIDILDVEPEDCLIALTWRMPFLDEDVTVIEIDTQVDMLQLNDINSVAQSAGTPASLFETDKEAAHV